MLSKGEFRDLYVYGYDFPEAYAIAKDGKMYYAFFTDPGKPFSGEVELRGLKPGDYTIADYVDGKDFGGILVSANTAPKLKVEFKDHLLLEVRTAGHPID